MWTWVSQLLKWFSFAVCFQPGTSELAVTVPRHLQAIWMQTDLFTGRSPTSDGDRPLVNHGRPGVPRTGLSECNLITTGMAVTTMAKVEWCSGPQGLCDDDGDECFATLKFFSLSLCVCVWGLLLEMALFSWNSIHLLIEWRGVYIYYDFQLKIMLYISPHNVF